MALLNSFLDLMKLNDEDYDDTGYDEDFEEAPKKRQSKTVKQASKPKKTKQTKTVKTAKASKTARKQQKTSYASYDGDDLDDDEAYDYRGQYRNDYRDDDQDDYEGDDDIDDYGDYEEESSPKKPFMNFNSRSSKKTRRSGNDGNGVYSGPKPVKSIYKYRPRDFSDCEEISRALLSGSPVDLLLDCVDDREAQNICNFMFGICFAIGGTAVKVSAKEFSFAPCDYQYDGDLDLLNDASGFTVPDFVGED